MNGKKVLLLEKGPHIGGSLTRFYKKNIPFDTGFHFTAGYSKGGILTDMLAAKLYGAGSLSSERAARLAGLPHVEFLLNLGFYKIFPLQAELNELEHPRD